jgi:hypothetical protein
MTFHLIQPELPTQVYCLNPSTGSVRVVADSFDHCNGICFNLECVARPSSFVRLSWTDASICMNLRGTICYITDTGLSCTASLYYASSRSSFSPSVIPFRLHLGKARHPSDSPQYHLCLRCCPASYRIRSQPRWTDVDEQEGVCLCS